MEFLTAVTVSRALPHRSGFKQKRTGAIYHAHYLDVHHAECWTKAENVVTSVAGIEDRR